MLKKFLSRFRFDPAMTGLVGVEREFFLVNSRGAYVPGAPMVVQQASVPEIDYEFSLFQIESKTRAVPIDRLAQELKMVDSTLRLACRCVGLRAVAREVGPSYLPSLLYRDNDGRFDRLCSLLSQDQIAAATRINGTHIHVGMPDMKTAFAAYQQAIRYCRYLNELGDHSSGQRLALFAQVDDIWPVAYSCIEEWYQDLEKRSRADDPTTDWRLIRISTHGTLEFRNFGATDNIQEIAQWARHCRAIFNEKEVAC